MATQKTNGALKHVQTARLRYRPDTGQYRLSLTAAIRAAGFGVGANFRYLPGEVEEFGLLPVFGSDDGGLPNDHLTYSVVGEGETGEVLRLLVPKAALEALGISTDPTVAQAGDLPLVDVYAGDRIIAFDKSNARTIPAGLLPGGARRESDDREVVVEQVQTVIPRLQTEGIVSAALTPAIDRAELNWDRKAGGIEFLPTLATELDGLVPAILHEQGDGRSGAIRSISRGGADGQVPYVNLPEPVLSALDLSVEDYDDALLFDRPPLRVFASTGVVALARSSQRNDPVILSDMDTASSVSTSLIDVGGIGTTLAERLRTAGYKTIEDLEATTDEELMAIKGLGERRAERIRDDLGDRSP